MRRELSVDPNAVRALVQTTLRDYPAVTVNKVYVHPEDLPVVREALPEGTEAAGDASIARGGAMLETEQGRLDARIETPARGDCTRIGGRLIAHAVTA